MQPRLLYYFNHGCFEERLKNHLSTYKIFINLQVFFMPHGRSLLYLHVHSLCTYVTCVLMTSLRSCTVWGVCVCASVIVIEVLLLPNHSIFGSLHAV